MIRAMVSVLLATGMAQAQEVFTTDTGRVYALDPIDGGGILVNADDPADEIMLLQDCGAQHARHGNGSWAWDGAGLLVMFAETDLRFDGPLPFDAPDCGT
ncbi:MAG: hypothetical protein ACT4OK_05405 [Gemmobacter sp.]